MNNKLDQIIDLVHQRDAIDAKLKELVELHTIENQSKPVPSVIKIVATPRKKITDYIRDAILNDLRNKVPVSTIAKLRGVSGPTVYLLKKTLDSSTVKSLPEKNMLDEDLSDIGNM